MVDLSEAHKERAYIAASRRHDRGIEARLESARQASKIHKKRTGRALRISEEIILGDAAYEEEEPVPRRRHMSSSSLHSVPWATTGGASISTTATAGGMGMGMGMDMNMGATSSSLPSPAFTDKEWRENLVNQAFSQAFPQLDARLSQRWPAQYVLSSRDHHFLQRGQMPSPSRTPSRTSSSFSSQSALSSQLADMSGSAHSSPVLPTRQEFVVPGHVTYDGGNGSDPR